ncbi:hypothetical protein GCM10011391_30050 [Pullulanibacillus camelliae]|uniref:Xylose isomerase-like TIM barrel domain-containing protein n=1 Tax=Pullulanibacillus camelliae TaxID=1707096 RepID=A0A8J2YKP3_9BACL|nr:sugar phosphate isomerase/epimerase family protein [Pullulanibacillus camelliae]GGE49219.1 hypothetical protein GCM10011391_30050 [Pullulanibacillus camelliae]
MKLGCCASIDQAERVKAAGFDFLEGTVASLIPGESDKKFKEEVLKPYEESPIAIEAFNGFIPSHLPLVGERADREAIHAYLEKALERMQLIGARIVVFGSGGARHIPQDIERAKGEQQILEFLEAAGQKAKRAGITVVIEPLNRKECNVINSVSEAVRFARQVNHPAVQVLADFYHMDEEDEPLDHLLSAAKYLKHIHVADTGRGAPGTGHYPYKQFSSYVREAGYSGGISIECLWDDFAHQVEKARHFLAEQFSDQ